MNSIDDISLRHVCRPEDGHKMEVQAWSVRFGSKRASHRVASCADLEETQTGTKRLAMSEMAYREQRNRRVGGTCLGRKGIMVAPSKHLRNTLIENCTREEALIPVRSRYGMG